MAKKNKKQPAYFGGEMEYERRREPVLDKDGKQKLDKDGNPMFRNRKVRDPQAGFMGAKPATMPNISPAEIGAAGTKEGARSLGELAQAYRPLFDTLAAQQRGQIGELSDVLRNNYTREARQGITASMRDARQLSGLGQSLASQSAEGFRTAGPTSIEQALFDQGQADLALGRSLSPEQMRDAAQSARQAFAARGLGTGLGAASAELLNRDRYATEREAQRRQFAAGANQMREENVMNRRDAAGRLGALGGGLLGEAGASRQRGGLMMTQIDPYARAIDGGLALGQSAQQYGLNAAGNQFNRGLDLFSNASTFNVNRQDNLLTNYQNMQGAIRGANMTANATTAAANAAKPKWYETAFNAVGNFL
jgi:hypothetical protein